MTTTTIMGGSLPGKYPGVSASDREKLKIILAGYCAAVAGLVGLLALFISR